MVMSMKRKPQQPMTMKRKVMQTLSVKRIQPTLSMKDTADGNVYEEEAASDKGYEEEEDHEEEEADDAHEEDADDHADHEVEDAAGIEYGEVSDEAEYMKRRLMMLMKRKFVTRMLPMVMRSLRRLMKKILRSHSGFDV